MSRYIYLYIHLYRYNLFFLVRYAGGYDGSRSSQSNPPRDDAQGLGTYGSVGDWVLEYGDEECSAAVVT